MSWADALNFVARCADTQRRYPAAEMPASASARKTILCFDCKELMDVVAAVLSGFEKPGMELTGESEENLLLVRIKCQRGSNHNWREWNAPDVCPRCGNSMELGHRIKFGINLSVCAEGRARRGVCEHEPRSLPRRARRERVSLVALARGAAYEI